MAIDTNFSDGWPMIHPARASILTIRRLAFQAALAAGLLLPMALLHARAGAEMLIGGLDALFLLRSALARDWRWARQSFVVAAGLWWAWGVICSLLGTGGLGLALAALRLPLLAVALGDWVLAGGMPVARDRRRAMWAMLAASAGWIALEAWQQDLTGTNLFGAARYFDGALTGPFRKPRAGPAYLLLFFPVLVPAVLALLARPGLRARGGGVLLAMGAALTMVLIGQRMPTALMALGLVVCALLVPRLRLASGCAVAAGLAGLAVLPWVSPLAYAKLVGQTAGQIAHFGQSDYGLIYVRAVAVWQAHPWLGLGLQGFRRGCGQAWAMHGVAWLGVGDAGGNGGLLACNLHPHNYYLEALDDAGLPGLALFAAMGGAMLWRLGRGLANRPPALLPGAFVGLVVALWPLASTSAFTSVPNAGWIFLVAGMGFAVSPVRGGERHGGTIV